MSGTTYLTQDSGIVVEVLGSWSGRILGGFVEVGKTPTCWC